MEVAWALLDVISELCSSVFSEFVCAPLGVLYGRIFASELFGLFKRLVGASLEPRSFSALARVLRFVCVFASLLSYIVCRLLAAAAGAVACPVETYQSAFAIKYVVSFFALCVWGG